MTSMRLQRALRSVRLRGPLSTDDTAKVLHYLLLTLFTWNGLWTIVLLPYSTGHPPQLTAISLIEAALAAALVKLRLGSLRAASWIYLGGVWLFATVVIAQNGGTRSVVLALYVTLPVSAAWLLGHRASSWTTGGCLISALVFAVLESANVKLPRTIPGTAIGIWIQLAAAVLMGVIPLAQVLRTLTEALTKVREQFESLKRQDDKLRESEEGLRASEVLLRDAQRLARVGSWDRYIETGKSHWSDEIRRIFGLPNDAPASLPAFVNYVHPQDREKVLEDERNVCSTRAPVETEYRIIRPDGEVRLLRSITEAITNDQGMPVRIVGATQDITEQVKARELLRESEERLKNAERLAHVGHWHWDLRTNRVTWSEECYRIFGRPRDYAPSHEDFLHAVVPQDRELVERGARQRLTENSGSSIELRIVRPDGAQRTIRSVSEVLPDEEGSPVRVFGAVLDITEVRRAQEETVARQKLESVGTLASGIAHDFNNLLGGVLAQTELALSELAAGVNPEEELTAIREVAIRGSEIVRELMIYAGKESAVVGLVDVSRIVKEMVELLKVSVSKHAVLETDLGEDLPAVRANAAQLRQVVMNLVTNASDAIGDRDAVIRVTTSCVKVDQESSEGISDRLAAGDYVQLTVSDTGHGMPLETQARVFDPFFTTKLAGHGLGLSIVHGIVRCLGGAIHLTSEPDKGTTLQILLPWAERTAETFNGPMPAAEEPARLAQSATVLIVEDEDALRQAVAKMLGKAGFEVLEASDGSAAIDLLRAKGREVDVVLLDLTLPGASSHEVVVEAAKARPDLKVVLTSAYGEEMATATWSTPLIHSFIRKPYQFGDLARTLRDALPS